MVIEVEREPAESSWASGPWSASVRGDELADIRWRGRLVLRGIRWVVRDHDWRTPPPRVESSRADGDGLELVVRYRAWEVDHRAVLRVSVAGDGALRVEGAGESLSAFDRNRIGFVVLHPIADAGAAVTVTTPGGATHEGAFPVAISPHQPFHDIAGFAWLRDGLRGRLAFGGDVFETEDQRNWTDASFKTYSTPLGLPFPVAVRPGDRVEQWVELRVEGADAGPGGPPSDAAPAVEAVDLLPVDLSIPALGVLVDARALAAGFPPEPEPEPGLGVGVGVGFALAEVSVADPSAADVVTAAVATGAPLDLRITARRPADIAPLVALVPPGRLLRLGAFDAVTHVAEEPLRDAARAALADRDDATLVVGTRAHFTELNRTHERLPTGGADAAFSVTPQMHAVEVRHIVDSLATHARIAEDARRIAGGAPVHVGPVTLEPRFNAVATRATPGDDEIEHDSAYALPFVEPWLVAALLGWAEGGVASATLLRSGGVRGLGATSAVRAMAGRRVVALGRATDLVAARLDDGRLVLAELSGRSREVAIDDRMLALEPWEVALR